MILLSVLINQMHHNLCNLCEPYFFKKTNWWWNQRCIFHLVGQIQVLKNQHPS